MMMEIVDDIQVARGHGIESAYYSSNGERYQPMMSCICGFTTGREWYSWEEAGASFDEHLREVAE